MLDHNFEPGFKAKLHQKDMRIALQTAHELGVALPCAAIAAQYLNALIGSGLGDLDSSAILLPQEQLSGISLSDDTPPVSE
jgi:2-hydroxy-3-oxopropionate reductase